MIKYAIAKSTLIVLLITISQKLCAQDKRGFTTLLGCNGAAAEFDGSNNSPVIKQYYPVNPFVVFWHGHSNICDSATGRPLIFSNGYQVYDTAGNILLHGDSLVSPKLYSLNADPASVTSQGSLLLPKGSANKFWHFVVGMSDSAFTYWNTNPLGDGRFPYDLLEYSIIDMNANGGAGAVTLRRQNLLNHVELFKTGMMACKHANGYDWWLIKQAAASNKAYIFLVTADTVMLDTIQEFAGENFWYYDLAGQSCFSNKGDKYAFVSVGFAKLVLFDFDRCYGRLRNLQVINIPVTPCFCKLDTLHPGTNDGLTRGIAFSPNDSFIYLSHAFNQFQYEINVSDSAQAWYHIYKGPDTSFIHFNNYDRLQLAPNGRIYVGRRDASGSTMCVINNPNAKGAACEFCPRCLRIDSMQGPVTSFANMPKYDMPALPYICPPMLIENGKGKIENEVVLFPNPASDAITVKYKSKTHGTLYLYNTLGEQVLQRRLLHTQEALRIDVGFLPSGVYLYKVEFRRRVVNGKLKIENERKCC
ncbi:MAG: hypothetical protein RL660_2417 [Bacteroidota bacterium]|jgi:hypothetical protein